MKTEKFASELSVEDVLSELGSELPKRDLMRIRRRRGHNSNSTTQINYGHGSNDNSTTQINYGGGSNDNSTTQINYGDGSNSNSTYQSNG